MKKRNLVAALVGLYCVCTACESQNTANDALQNVATTQEQNTSIMETTIDDSEKELETSELVSEATEVVEDNTSVLDIDASAKVFAKLVYEELENNKTAENPTTLKPISNDYVVSDTGFDPTAFEADVFLVDTNFDGIPELFAGGHGTMGTGRYSVFTADGITYGNEMFTWWLDGFCVIDNAIYASSGSNYSWGWTKLCEGLPTIYVDGAFSETDLNTVVVAKNGEQQTLEDQTYEEVMDLYRTELGVEYAQLQGSDGEIPFAYVRDYLRVPDTENYTEDDIYDCILDLLAQYAALAE